MSSVGLRALQQNASAVVARAQAGEVIEITDRGRPVATLAPLHRRPLLEELEAAGLLQPATVDQRTLPLPLPRLEGTPTASEVLAEMRDAERW